MPSAARQSRDRKGAVAREGTPAFAVGHSRSARAHVGRLRACPELVEGAGCSQLGSTPREGRRRADEAAALFNHARGHATAIAATNRARRPCGGAFRSARRSFAMFLESCAPVETCRSGFPERRRSPGPFANRAERIPGLPPSPSTSRPLSSAIARHPYLSAHAPAFRAAFSA